MGAGPTAGEGGEKNGMNNWRGTHEPQEVIQRSQQTRRQGMAAGKLEVGPLPLSLLSH